MVNVGGKIMRKMQNASRIKKRSYRSQQKDLPLPDDAKIAELSRMLMVSHKQEEAKQRYARVKDVLTLLGIGTVLGLSLFVTPGAAILAKPFLDEKREKEWEEWKRFNPSYLKRTLYRMRKEKLVTMTEVDGEEVVVLTKHGKRRILKYSLDDLTIEKPHTWDGRWRMVMYDVSHRRKALRDLFRQTLKGLGFYQLQESVWLYPYPCESQVTFLREYYGVGNEVLYVIATTLEDDAPYKTYFGI